MAKIVYFSITGQTRKFTAKLPNAKKVEIQPGDPFIELTEPYLLVIPTYVKQLTEPVNDFLETEENLKHCAGIFGGGNRNFAGLFCFTARDLEKEYGIPVLHEFEFQGSQKDVQKLEEELNKIEN